MVSRPIVQVLGLFALVSCAEDGGASAPHTMIDASVAALDAGVRGDGAPASTDARAPVDAGTSGADAGISCTLPGGTVGVCIDVEACAAMPGHASTPGYCPGPASIQCCAVAPPPMPACDATDVPEPNLGLVEEPGEAGCPAGMLRIGGQFCIDRFEAALEVVVPETPATAASWSPYFNPGARRVVARSWRGAVPQGYMTGIQAAAACGEAGKRLCTDTEWLRACRGPDSLTFPYGDTRETGVCNDHRDEHPAVELFGSVINLTSPCLNELHDTVDLTGSRKDCVTAEGAFDMMGNLHEWTSDPNGTFRGGFYVDTVENGPGCLYVTTAHNTSHYDYSTGFRCCVD